MSTTTATATARSARSARPARSGRRLLAVLVAALSVLTALSVLPASAQAAGTRVPVGQLGLTGRGATFIATFEGFVARPYDDPGGNCTIGFGHLIHRGTCTDGDRRTWGTITRSRGTTLLRNDAAGVVSGLRSQLAGKRYSTSEFDALVSFTYNIGTGNFSESSVKKDLLAVPPRWGQVPGHMRLWVYSGGQYLCGLYRRRVNEGHLFSSGSYAISSPSCPNGAATAGPDGAVSVAPGTRP